MNKPKVYLAGGFHSGWDDHAVSQMPSWECVQPKLSGLKEMHEFTPWDLGHISTSDAILCYVEADNPGMNWMFELGYARARGKYIVLVVDDDYYRKRGVPQRYIGMALASADVVIHNLDDAILHLNDWVHRSTMEIGLAERILADAPFDAVAFADLHPSLKAAFEPVEKETPTIPLIEGWIVDFVGDQPDDFEPDSVVQGTDETGFPDFIWGRAYSFEEALKTASVIALDEGVVFSDDILGTLVRKAHELDMVPYQTPGHRYVCIRRTGI